MAKAKQYCVTKLGMNGRPWTTVVESKTELLEHIRNNIDCENVNSLIISRPIENLKKGKI